MRLNNFSIDRVALFFKDRGACCLVSPYDRCCTSSLTREEEKLIHGLCTKRQKEFAMGRYLSRKAFKEAGIPSVPILMGKWREPLWPGEVVGSIAHTNNTYAAAVAEQAVCRSLGVDIEKADRKIGDSAFELLCPSEELSVLETANLESGVARIALFSAKESFYKLLYPLVQKRFFFDGARLVQATADRFVLELTRGLGAGFAAGWHTEVAVYADSRLVTTAAALSA